MKSLAQSAPPPRHIAVLDIGKSNAKLALVRAADLAEIAVVSCPNRVLQAPPYPHHDLAGLWRFFLEQLTIFQENYGIDALSVSAHGASGVLLDAAGTLAAPMLDYEFLGPDDLAPEYEVLRPDFAETGSARLAGGLNLGAQLHWQLAQDRALRDRIAHIVTYPQYWGLRLTGEIASDVTSLGCHSDLWLPQEARPSALLERLGLGGKLAPPRRPQEILGKILPEVAARTGISPEVTVRVGIHDSNASLYPHLLAGREQFSVLSTGTWVIAMAMGGAPIPLDPARDLLINVNAFGDPVPTARFMGGREFDLIMAGEGAVPDAEDRAAVLQKPILLLPSVEPHSGPFPHRQSAWVNAPERLGQRQLALSYYLALMSDHCLGLIGARGVTIVEGPFAQNADFLQMLAALRPEGVECAASRTGTSVGAAMLCLEAAKPPATRKITPQEPEALRAYAALWRQTLGL